ncbi:orotidine 5'-phosphate decarboxylase / HUMPS family protein [Promicromonospora sp. NPDC023987]|uniref:orotidine 5'-phosphate decarboxylase / HUMPS family protein n=1 Tax=Promicromonospora sp. NPDC023987 TaxID=3155360 RepID=UPI00340E21BB
MVSLEDLGDLIDETSPASGNGTGRPAESPDIAAASTSRTAATTVALESGTVIPDSTGLAAIDDFITGNARVFLLSGAAGTGKSVLVRHAATVFAGRADFQVHLASRDGSEGLASGILRYGSIAPGHEPLLTLETFARTLTRPLVVTIDAIGTPEEFDSTARAVDALLRQVTTPNLRFVLAIRTPPVPDVAVFPLLSATIHPRGSNTSHETSRWSLDRTGAAWDRERPPGVPEFLVLHPSVRDLIRLPLFMSLLRSAGPLVASDRISPYQLVDHCVRALATAGNVDADGLVRSLGDAAISSLGPRLRSVVGELATDNREVSAVPPALAQRAPNGSFEFAHSLIHEYFAATRIALSAPGWGRSRLVSLITEMAKEAESDAVAAGLLHFTVMALDQSAPHLMASVALAPALVGSRATAQLLEIATDGANFAGPEVLRACVRVCETEGPSALLLARALLHQPHIGDALDEQRTAWLFGLLRQHGSDIWTNVADHIAQTMDGEASAAFVRTADLSDVEVAAFIAGHLDLFAKEEERAGVLTSLLGHDDWRVRAAVADGLARMRPAAPVVAHGTELLAADHDYKVRAAVARVLCQVPDNVLTLQLPTLLNDTNWYVRSRVLDALTQRSDGFEHVESILREIEADPSWRKAPGYVRALLDRLALLRGRLPAVTTLGNERTLVPLLREIRAGALEVPSTRAARIAELAAGSASRIVAREGAEVAVTLSNDGGETTTRRPASEWYRRLRGARHLQIALDLGDLALAVDVARAAVAGGATFVEVGDPLIKAHGVAAIEAIKVAVPDAVVVAEMMSSDWGRDQVETAVAHGADAVLLIGPATLASVAAASAAARRLDTAILLDAPAALHTPEWAKDMMRAGVDGFAVTTNIDIGPAGRHPLRRAEQLRHWTRLPVAVSGGFTASDPAVITSPHWDTLIVGRSVTESVNPLRATRDIVALLSQPSERKT